MCDICQNIRHDLLYGDVPAGLQEIKNEIETNKFNTDYWITADTSSKIAAAELEELNEELIALKKCEGKLKEISIKLFN